SRRARAARSMERLPSKPGAGPPQREDPGAHSQSVPRPSDRRDRLPARRACTRLARMLALLTLLAGAALADVAPPPDALPGPQSSGDRRVGPFTRDTYPSEVSARPLTLPAGLIRAGAALDADWFRLSTFEWSTRLGITGSYGLTDALELGASAAFGLSPVL